MANLDANHYQHLINVGTLMVESGRQQIPTIPPQNVPGAHYSLGLSGINAAVGYLMSGQVEESRNWFRQSAIDFLAAQGIYPETVTAEKRAMECALFCGDVVFQRDMAQQILPRESKRMPLPLEYPYAMFLKYRILEDEAEAVKFAEQAAAVNVNTMKKRGGYGTLGAACLALASRQHETFSAALSDLLREHKSKTSQGRKKLPDGIVCFPGAALCVLSKQMGWILEANSPFIPEPLLF